MNYQILHRLPGRLRLRLAALASSGYRDEIARILSSDSRIKDICIRAACRSLTIVYEPNSLSIREILALLDTKSATTIIKHAEELKEALDTAMEVEAAPQEPEFHEAGAGEEDASECIAEAERKDELVEAASVETKVSKPARKAAAGTGRKKKTALASSGSGEKETADAKKRSSKSSKKKEKPETRGD